MREINKCDWQISRSEKTTVSIFYIKNIRECHQVSSGGCCNQSTMSVWVTALHHMPHLNQFNGISSQGLKKYSYSSMNLFSFSFLFPQFILFSSWQIKQLPSFTRTPKLLSRKVSKISSVQTSAFQNLLFAQIWRGFLLHWIVYIGLGS